MIETKLVRLRKDVVAQYRRIRTPWFCIDLKPKTYKRKEILVFPFVPFVHSHPDIKAKIWHTNKGERLYSSKLTKALDIANSKVTDNILRLKA